MNRSVQTILDTTKATNSEKPGLITIVAKTSEKSTKTRVRVPGDFDYRPMTKVITKELVWFPDLPYWR